MPYTLLTRGRGIIKYIIPKLQTGQDVEVLETWFNFCLFFKGHLKYSCRHVKHLTLHRCLEKTGFWRQITQFAYLFSHKHICCLSGRPKALLHIKTQLGCAQGAGLFSLCMPAFLSGSLSYTVVPRIKNECSLAVVSVLYPFYVNLFLFYAFMRVSASPAFMSVYHMPAAPEEASRGYWIPWDRSCWWLWVTLVGAGNWTQVIWKSRQCS